MQSQLPEQDTPNKGILSKPLLSDFRTPPHAFFSARLDLDTHLPAGCDTNRAHCGPSDCWPRRKWRRSSRSSLRGSYTRCSAGARRWWSGAWPRRLGGAACAGPPVACAPEGLRRRGCGCLRTSRRMPSAAAAAAAEGTAASAAAACCSQRGSCAPCSSRPSGWRAGPPRRHTPRTRRSRPRPHPRTSPPPCGHACRGAGVAAFRASASACSADNIRSGPIRRPASPEPPGPVGAARWGSPASCWSATCNLDYRLDSRPPRRWCWLSAWARHV